MKNKGKRSAKKEDDVKRTKRVPIYYQMYITCINDVVTHIRKIEERHKAKIFHEIAPQQMFSGIRALVLKTFNNGITEVQDVYEHLQDSELTTQEDILIKIDGIIKITATPLPCDKMKADTEETIHALIEG